MHTIGQILDLMQDQGTRLAVIISNGLSLLSSVELKPARLIEIL